MVKELLPADVYDYLVCKSYDEEANLNLDEVKKNLIMAVEDYAFGQNRYKLPNPSWRLVSSEHLE